MLWVHELRVRYTGSVGLACPSLNIDAGEIVAITGPSGCGKSTLAMAVLGLLPRGTNIEGTVRFGDVDMTALDERQFRARRGRELVWIPQDVAQALSPFTAVARQLAEVVHVHSGAPLQTGVARAIELLTRLRLDDAATRVNEHPHRWSGGMLQRAVIAMALMLTPRLIVADEPTSALDVDSRNAVADILRERAAHGAGIMLLSHDRELIRALAHRTVSF